MSQYGDKYTKWQEKYYSAIKENPLASEIFKIKKIPFRQITFNKKNEEELGEIFTFFVLETILLSRLMNVNPFDQPAVEEVKILTKSLLKNEKD